MSLAEYAGPANSTNIMPFLVGERIVGAFMDYQGGSRQIVLILESGHAFVFNANGSFWRESEPDTRARIAMRRRELESRIGELRLLDEGVPEVPAANGGRL